MVGARELWAVDTTSLEDKIIKPVDMELTVLDMAQDFMETAIAVVGVPTMGTDFLVACTNATLGRFVLLLRRALFSRKKKV